MNNPIHAYGYEFDFQYFPKERFHISLNHSYAKVNEDSTSLLKFLPILKKNLLLTYTVFKKYPLNIALIGRHVLRNGDGDNPNGYLLVDANLIFPIIKQLSIEFQVKNILNRKVNDFSYINVPMPGRFFMGTIATKF